MTTPARTAAGEALRVPAHQRENHEQTDGTLYNFNLLFRAAMRALDDDMGSEAHDLMIMARDLMEEVQRDRAIEWAGLGGTSPSLTAEETATARGEA